MYTYNAFVSRVIDGDTIECEWVDLGFYIRLNNLRFRLRGIDAPEMRGSERVDGKASQVFLKHLIEDKEVTLRVYKADSFGRWLADVYYSDINVNEFLIRQGMATNYEG